MPDWQFWKLTGPENDDLLLKQRNYDIANRLMSLHTNAKYNYLLIFTQKQN